MTGKKFGLVIGNNYPNSNKELKFAVADAKKMKEILENKDICGFDEVVYLPDRTSKEASSAIEKILRKAEDDLVFIYFSGHGKKDFENNLCLLFNDTDEDALFTTSLTFDFINKCVRFPARKSVIIILDCCYSGAAGIRDTDVTYALKKHSEALKEHSGLGTIIITSTGSTGSPKAKEDENLGHGIFTNFLIEGLENSNADKDNDGLISIDELYDYAFKKTIEISAQSPKKEGSVEGEIVIGTNPPKIKEREYNEKKKKLFEEFSDQLPSDILGECQIILRKCYKTPSLLEKYDKIILSFLEPLLKNNLLPEKRGDAVQNCIEAVQYKKEKEEQERKRREEEKTRKEEEKARKEKEEQERKQREEEKARKEREEQKRKEEERKNLLSAGKKPIESDSKTAYKRSMEEEDWNRLLRRIKDGKCTPFLGAGVSAEKIPIGSKIANEWAREYDYPMEDSDNLARVAQFVAVTEEDEMFPRDEICNRITELSEEVPPTYFETPDEIHGVLADLPLPVYITTTYDDLMIQALKSRGKTPIHEICRWNEYLMQRKPTSTDFDSTLKKPLMYHLYGCYKIPESLVLTEDDYQNFLVAVSKVQKLLPPRIQEAFTSTSFLFLGYRTTDWDFRVLCRILDEYLGISMGRKHIFVQLVPGNVSETHEEKAQKYLDRYFEAFHIQVYWQDCREFAAELRTRWEAFNRGTIKKDADAANIGQPKLKYEQPKEETNKISILFLAADPTDESRLRLGEEFREIQERLKLAKFRDRFTLELPQLSVRPSDISQSLIDIQPQIVHFSGHGTPIGALCFENLVGETHPIEPDALAALFEQFSGQVNCVVLNACYSEIQAKAIAKHIKYVIGMNQAIGDKAAVDFAIGFYQALGGGRSIEDAYKFGCVHIQLHGIPEHLTPVLITKDRS